MIDRLSRAKDSTSTIPVCPQYLRVPITSISAIPRCPRGGVGREGGMEGKGREGRREGGKEEGGREEEWGRREGETGAVI